ncbi:hypothetical protein FISHEDRAFT_21512, partial [Fistulina hepatica ATCC 64428]
ALLGLAGWSIIPDLATRKALPAIHFFAFKYMGAQPPRQGTPQYQQHYRYTYAFVVLAYLLYNLVNGMVSLPPNFYQLLGVAPNVDETALRYAFKQFARRNHPDRPGVGPAGAQQFLVVRDAYEALKNDAVRYAYDRFGPEVLAWKKCVTPRDYVQTGLMRSCGFYIASLVGLFLISRLNPTSQVSFWRYVLFATLLGAEISLVFSPSPGGPFFDNAPLWVAALRTLFPRRVIHQHILFLHQLFLFFSVALSKVVPVLFPDIAMHLRQLAEKEAQQLVSVTDEHITTMLHTTLHAVHPFTPETRVPLGQVRSLTSPSPSVISALSDEMVNLVIERNLRQEDGPLRSTWESALVRARRAASEPPLPL